MLKNLKDGTPLQPNKGDGIERAMELTVAADKSIDIYIDNAQQILQQNAQCSQFGLLSSFNKTTLNKMIICETLILYAS